MNKKLLILSIATILAAPSAFAAYTLDTTPTENTGTTDDPRDVQNVTITVPEVALLDIGDADVAIPALTALTDAGTGFPGVNTASAVQMGSTFSLSSNVKAISPITRNLDVSIVSGSIPDGGTLKIATTGAGTAGTSSITGTTVTGSAATAIGNEKTTAGTITYKFGATGGTNGIEEGMIAYTEGTTSGNLTLAYTLSND